MLRVSRFRIVAIAALAALGLALAAACGGDSGSGASGSIRFLIFGDPAEINAYQTLIKSFNEEEPDIDVQLVEASDREDLIARLSTSLAGGSPPAARSSRSGPTWRTPMSSTRTTSTRRRSTPSGGRAS